MILLKIRLEGGDEKRGSYLDLKEGRKDNLSLARSVWLFVLF